MAALDYLKEPQAIYDASFGIVRAEADLAALPASLERIAVRMIHACGMTDIADDLRFGADIAKRAHDALKSGAPILPVGITGTKHMGTWLRVFNPTGKIRVNIGPEFTLPAEEGRVSRETLESCRRVARMPRRRPGRSRWKRP